MMKMMLMKMMIVEFIVSHSLRGGADGWIHVCALGRVPGVTSRGQRAASR